MQIHRLSLPALFVFSILAAAQDPGTLQPRLNPTQFSNANAFLVNTGDCSTCDGGDVVVDQDSSVDFTTPKPTFTGDPDLAPFFNPVQAGDLPENWMAEFDLGGRRLVISPGVTLTVNTAPGGNGQSSPGLDIRTTCSAVIGGVVRVRGYDGHTGDLNLFARGGIRVSGEVINEIVGTWGITGNLTLGSACGDIDIRESGRVRLKGSQMGGRDLALLAFGQGGDVRVAGHVEAVFDYNRSPKLNVAAFGGDIVVDGSHLLGWEYGRRLTSGVRLRSTAGSAPDSLTMVADGSIEIIGHGAFDGADQTQVTFNLDQALRQGELAANATVTLTDVADDQVRVDIAVPGGDGALKGVFGNLFDESLVGQLTAAGDDLNDHRFFIANGSNGLPGYWMAPPGGWDFALGLGPEGGTLTSASFTLTAPGLTWRQLLASQEDGWSLGLLMTAQGGVRGGRGTKLNESLLRVGMRSPLFLPAFQDGAVAVKNKGEITAGGSLAIQALNGHIHASNWAIDNANGGVGGETVWLEAKGDIRLEAGDSTLANLQGGVTVVSGEGRSQGAENRLRSHGGGIFISPGAVLSSDSPARDSGRNLLIACSGVFNQGRVTPADTDTSDDSGTCPLSIVINQPVTDSVFNIPTVTVSGTVSHADATVEVNGLTATLTNLDWTVEVPLTEEGFNTLSASAHRNAEKAVATRRVILDSVSPIIKLTAPETIRPGAELDYDWTVGDDGELTVSVTRDGELVSSEANGQATYAVPSDTRAGEILLRVTASDAAGNTAAEEHTVTILPLELSLALSSADEDSPLDGSWTNSPTQTYNIEVGADVVQIEVALAGEVETLTPVAGAAVWSADNLIENSYTIQFTYVGPNDERGSRDLGLNIDRTPPTLDFQPVLETTPGAAIDFTAVAADEASGLASFGAVDGINSAIQITDGSQPAWTWIAPTQAGPWTLTLTTADVAGNSFSQDTVIQVGVVPTGPFALNWLTPDSGLVTAADALTVTGRITQGVAQGVTLNGVEATLSGSDFSVAVPADEEGLLWLNLQALSTDGQVIRRRRQVTVDRTPPQITVNGGLVQRGTGDTLILTGSVSDAWDPIPSLSAPGLPDRGSFSNRFQLSGLQRSDFPLTLRAVDHVGNSGEVTVTWTPDPTAGVTVSLEASPNSASTGSAFWLSARAQALGDSRVTRVSIVETTGGTTKHQAAAQADSVRHYYRVPDRSDVTVLEFRAEAETADGSRAEAIVTVAVGGDLLLEGHIYHAETGHPLPQAEVTLMPQGQAVAVDADGYYRFWLVEPAEYISVNANGFSGVRLQGPFLPGDISLLPDARLTPLGQVVATSATLTPAGVLAARINADFPNEETFETTLDWSGSAVNLTQLANQAMPLATPIGWAPHTAFRLGNASGSGSWRGPPVTHGVLVSFTPDQSAWRVEGDTSADWALPVFPDRYYALLIADAEPGSLGMGENLLRLPQSLGAPGLAVNTLQMSTSPELSIARRGVSSLAVIDYPSSTGWSGQRVEILRSESYRALNPTTGDNVESDLRQQAVLYRHGGGLRALLPLVPRRNDLVPTLRSALIGGPVQPVSTQPGAWVDGEPYQSDVLPGMILEAASETRFWIRAESVRAPQPLFSEWTDLGAFRFSSETRGAAPDVRLAMQSIDSEKIGAVALFRRETNPLGASVRLMGLLDETGGVDLLPGRQWLDGFYFLQQAPEPIVLGRIALNPSADGYVRLLNTPLGDTAPGYLPLHRGAHFVSGRAQNGAAGQVRVDVSGEESETLQITLATDAPSLRLTGSIPADGDDLTLAPQFMLIFNRSVDETTVSPQSLQVRVNGEPRQALWRWEQGSDRAQGFLRHLIEDEGNDVLQPGDTLTITGDSQILSNSGLPLEPFAITAVVPASATPLPLNLDNLFLTYDAAVREAVIHMHGPVGPAGTIADFINEQTAASGSFVQVDGAAQTLRLGSALGDPIEVTLTAPNGAAVFGRLTLYFDGEPDDSRVAFTVGPAGGSFDLPGAGRFTLPEGAVNDIRTISFTQWDQEEPDTNLAPDVTNRVWLIRGLQTANGVAPMTWTPDIQFDEEGKPLNSVQLNQDLPYLPEWLRDQLVERGEEIPERPMIELASPWIQESFRNIPVNFVADNILGAPPEGFNDPKRKAVAGWGWAAFIFERDIAMSVNNILSNGVEGRGTVKFGKVGAFSYKQQVIDGEGTLRAEEGELIGGAWVLGPVDHAPGNRQYPIQISLTDQSGSYWGSSVFWLPSNLQSLGMPTWASHPAFLSLAEKIYQRDRFQNTTPNTILQNFLPNQFYERHFGFWYVDPEGGIGHSRNTGLGLELKDTDIRNETGRKDATLSANFANTGEMPVGHDICFRWTIIDENDLDHSEIARLDGVTLESEIKTEEDGKILEVCVPAPTVGAHRVRVVVRNQYGLEMYASYGFTVLPESGAAVIRPSASEPFVLQSGVTPIPLKTEELSDVATGIGEIGGHDLIAVPFSEPVTTGDPETLGDQIVIEVAELGVADPEWKSWPVDFLHGETLEVLASSEEVPRIYVRTRGVLPGGHILRMRVLADGQIRDTGEESDEGPQALQADPELDEDEHYVAKWLTVGISGNVKDFTRNAVIDYATYGNWLFELSWTEQGNQQLIVYRTSGAGELSREQVIPLVETQAQIFAMMNRTARSIAFWPNPNATLGNPDAVPGYVLIGCKSHQRILSGGQRQTMRPARVKMYNVNKEPEYQLVGGMAFSDDGSESVRHMSVHDNLMLATTVWGGVSVVDLQGVLTHYEQNGLDDPAFRPKGEKPLFNTVMGKNQPATAILERYFPLQYPQEFFIPFAIGSPFQMEAVLAPRLEDGEDTGESELGFFGTGGIEFGSWYHGTPPIEFLLSGFDASYHPFDSSGDKRYDNQAARLKNWDLDGDRVDDRRIYFSGQDDVFTSDAPFLGKGALPSKFSPVMIKVLHHMRTDEMIEPRDIMVLRSNPGEGGDVHGGLMFVSVEARDEVNYLAYLRFDSRVKNIAVNESLQQVTAVSDNGRLLVVDIPSWIDLGLRFQADPEDEELADLNESISNPAEPIEQGDYLPGVLVDMMVPHARYPLAFMDDRIVVGDAKEQKQVILRPPLFINPGFYTDSGAGGRSRRLAIQVIPGTPSAENGESKTMVEVSFSLREDADVTLKMRTTTGEKDLWESPQALVSGKGTNTHSVIFPLEKVGLTEADVAEARIPLELERKLVLFGEPVSDPTDTEDVTLYLSVQTDPWGTGQAELNAETDVEPWSGRLSLTEGELPSAPIVGAPLSLFRKYSHHGFWEGSLGRGWYLPWESNLIWSVVDTEDGFGAMQVTMPSGEVHQLDYEEGEWSRQTTRYQSDDHYQIEAELGDSSDEHGGFPEEVTLNWGSDTLVFSLNRRWNSADFSNGDDDFIYSFNDDMEAQETETARSGRYLLKSWKRNTGGDTDHGWEVDHDGDRVSRISATHGDYQLSLKYRRHLGTGQRGLEKIIVEGNRRYEIEFRQDTEQEEYMALASAISNVFPGKVAYTYSRRPLGVVPGADHQIETLVMTRHRDMFGAVTQISYQDQNEQTALPAGFSWPYVNRLTRNGFANQDLSFEWLDALPGRTESASMTESEGGQSETYDWEYQQVGDSNDTFISVYSRNDFDTNFDWSGWPENKSIDRPNGVSETYHFDDLMRITQIMRTSEDGPVNSVTDISYVGNTSLESGMTGSNGIVTKADFDDFGRMTSFENGLGGKEAYRYSRPDNLTTSVTDETGLETTYSYDALGRTTLVKRLGYSERTEYRRNGQKVTVNGEAGLNFVDDSVYTIGRDGYSQQVTLTSSAPATANTSIDTQYDPWGRVKRVYRAGRPVFEASDFALAGPLTETMHWTHRGANRVNTYGEPGAEGYSLTAVSIGDVTTMEITNDDLGNPIQIKNHVDGVIENSTFNKMGDLTSLQKYNMEDGEAGALLETLTIDYNNINHKLITRNGQTYSIIFTPGETWNRLISGAFGQVSMRGSGRAWESMEGTVEGRRVGRDITRSADSETVSQIQGPRNVVKTISGDGRVYRIETAGRTLNQSFNGYGMVHRTWTTGAAFYEMTSSNGHFQRTEWKASGQTFSTAYEGALVSRNGKNNRVGMEISNWDALGRTTAYKAGDHNITVSYDNAARTRRLLRQKENAPGGVEVITRMDGLGRTVHRSVAEVVPGTPAEWERVDYRFQYGSGLESNRTGPGDRLIRFQGNNQGVDYFYHENGRFAGMTPVDDSQPLARKMEPGDLDFSISYDESVDENGNPIHTSTSVGPDGGTTVSVFDAAGQLLEKTREGLLLIANRYDGSGRLIQTENRQNHVTTFRYVGDQELPVAETTRAGDELHITLFQYDQQMRLTHKRERVELDEEGEYINGIYWRYAYDNQDRRTLVERGVNGEDYQVWERITYDINAASPADHRITDVQGVTWTLAYDPLTDQLISRTNDGGQGDEAFSESWRELDQGNVRRYSRNDNYFVEVESDYLDRVVRRTVFDAELPEERNFQQEWRYEFISDKRLASREEHPDGRVIERVFAEDGSLSLTRYATADTPDDVLEVATTYDDLNRLQSMTTSKGQQVDFGYDLLGRLQSESWNLAAFDRPLVTSYIYDDRSNQTGVLFPSGRRITRSFNPAGRIGSVIEGGSVRSSYDYDVHGQLLRIEQAGAVAQYDYDQLGRLTRQELQTAGELPVTRVESFGYVPVPGDESPFCDDEGATDAGHPDDIRCHQISWGGVNLESYYSYDQLGRLREQRTSQATGIPGRTTGSLTWRYDALGNIAELETPFGQQLYNYNSDGSLANRTFNGFRTDFSYDGAGRLIGETEFNIEGVETGYSRNFRYDERGFLSDVVENGPVQSLAQQFEYDVFGRLRASRNSALESNGWNVMTLSQPPIPGSQDLPIAMAVGPRTEEVLLAGDGSRGERVLGFGYGPQGLAHITNHPTNAWAEGAVTPHFTDPFQNTSAILEADTIRGPPTGSADLAVANFYEPGGRGVILDTADIVGTTPIEVDPLHLDWDIDNSELARDNSQAPDGSAPAWDNDLFHTLIPGFTGNTNVGGLLDPPDDTNEGEAARHTPAGLPDMPLPPLDDMGTRLYHAGNQSFTSPDEWAQFDPARDVFSANRFLYANADPVNHGDLDGRLPSLKIAMDYSGVSGLGNLAFDNTAANFTAYGARHRAIRARRVALNASFVADFVAPDHPLVEMLFSFAVEVGASHLDQFTGGYEQLNQSVELFGAPIGTPMGMDLFMESAQLNADLVTESAKSVLPGEISLSKFLSSLWEGIRSLGYGNKQLLVEQWQLAVGQSMNLTPAGLDALVGGGDLVQGIGEDLTRGDHGMSVNSLFGQSLCFAKDTPILTDSGRVPIQTIRVGHRVISLNADDDDPDPATDIEPDHYRLLTLEMERQDGSGELIHLKTLRPVTWLQLVDAAPGRWIQLNIEEMKLSGVARIVSIEPCPKLEEGPGNLVLTTFRSKVSGRLKLHLEGLEKPLELTPNHLLYSSDNECWVPAGKVVVGDQLETVDGSVRVNAIEQLADVQAVYNIEVENDHNYYVSILGLLSHNASAHVGELLEKSNKKYLRYLRELESITGRKIKRKQRRLLRQAWFNEDYVRLTTEGGEAHRKDFDRFEAIAEWERQTGQTWPTYDEDYISNKGNVVPKKGKYYDAHHIIENVYGGPHVWWNMHPAKFPDEHQGGIHTSEAMKALFK